MNPLFDPGRIPLATVSPSDEISLQAFHLSWAVYALATIIATAALFMRLQIASNRAAERNLAIAAILLGLIPLVFHLHLYQIDLAFHAFEDTPDNPPLWKVVALPILPTLLGFSLLLWKRPPGVNPVGGIRL